MRIYIIVYLLIIKTDPFSYSFLQNPIYTHFDTYIKAICYLCARIQNAGVQWVEKSNQ